MKIFIDDVESHSANLDTLIARGTFPMKIQLKSKNVVVTLYNTHCTTYSCSTVIYREQGLPQCNATITIDAKDVPSFVEKQMNIEVDALRLLY